MAERMVDDIPEEDPQIQQMMDDIWNNFVKDEVTDHPHHGQRCAFGIPKREFRVIVSFNFTRAVSRLPPEGFTAIEAIFHAIGGQVSLYGIKAITYARQLKPSERDGLVATYLKARVYTKINQWCKGEITGVQCVKDILHSCVFLAAAIGGGNTGEMIGASLGSCFGTRGIAVGAVTGAVAVGALAARTSSSLFNWLTRRIFDQQN